ncbi:hypothetical protein [uncultured Akkermansia sp.]|uniref:hypothetical protein n=1 Tax=uncultured Akkermansia sp. TaxID=512294 RepID=UPI00262B7252|nr:hypothetical protein [uncultured Akkermansia sp.]
MLAVADAEGKPKAAYLRRGNIYAFGKLVLETSFPGWHNGKIVRYGTVAPIPDDILSAGFFPVKEYRNQAVSGVDSVRRQ